MNFLNLLIVEDNAGDVELTLEVCRDIPLLTVHIVHDGDEALDFISRKGDHQYAPTPDLIFLDLNLPGTDGREVLRKVKSDPKLLHIPVIVVSSSANSEDIKFVYKHHANAYMVKPMDGSGYINYIRSTMQYWMDRVTLQNCGDYDPSTH